MEKKIASGYTFSNNYISHTKVNVPFIAKKRMRYFRNSVSDLNVNFLILHFHNANPIRLMDVRVGNV